jgi:hypothetical protein
MEYKITRASDICCEESPHKDAEFLYRIDRDYYSVYKIEINSIEEMNALADECKIVIEPCYDDGFKYKITICDYYLE